MNLKQGLLFLFLFASPFWTVADTNSAASSNTVLVVPPIVISNTTQVVPSITVGPIYASAPANEKEKACDWLAPVAEVLKYLFWPALFFWIVRTFKAEIAQGIKNLKSAKISSAEFNFNEEKASKPEQQARLNPLEQAPAAIRQFVMDVTKEFLRASSWNGLKVLYLCDEFRKKGVPFNLKAACEADKAMSYDYAFGYIVASCSAQFLRYQTPDNVNFFITQVFEDVQSELKTAIEGRLTFVAQSQGTAAAEEFRLQLKRLVEFIETIKA